MKKILSLIAGALMVLFVSGSAFAAFDNSLTLSMYNLDTTVEVGVELVDLTTWEWGTGTYVQVADDAFSADTFSATDWSAVMAGVFGMDDTTSTKIAYYASTDATSAEINKRASGTFDTSAKLVANYYEGLATDGVAVGSTGATASYWYTMDSSTTPGQYSGYNADYDNGEVSLASLYSEDIILYIYSGTLSTRSGALLSSEPIGSIKLTADGDVFVSTSAVPVPGAVWLLGSALLGLVGLRRKKA